MVASSRKLGAFVVCMLLAAGCTKGSGEGSAVGQVWAPECGLEGEPFDLDPDFFAMQPSASVEIIDIIMQRGSDLQSYSDGISVFIREPEMLKEPCDMIKDWRTDDSARGPRTIARTAGASGSDPTSLRTGPP